MRTQSPGPAPTGLANSRAKSRAKTRLYMRCTKSWTYTSFSRSLISADRRTRRRRSHSVQGHRSLAPPLLHAHHYNGSSRFMVECNGEGRGGLSRRMTWHGPLATASATVCGECMIGSGSPVGLLYMECITESAEWASNTGDGWYGVTIREVPGPPLAI